MKDSVLWKCLLNGVDDLTVGQIFQLHCEGNLPVLFSGDIQLKLPDKTPPFSLVLLGYSQKTDRTLDLQVTSYRAGEFKLPFIRVSDGESQVESSELEWTVKTVLTQDSKPVPAQGPFALDVPFSIYLSLTLLGALLAGIVGFLFWRHRRKLALNADLEAVHSHLSPIRQFEASIRSLRFSIVRPAQLESENKKEAIYEMDRIIRVYFLRTLKKQTLKAHWKKMCRLIEQRGDSSFSQQVHRYFKELEVSKTKFSEMDKLSLLQLLEGARSLVIHFEGGGKKE